MKFMNTWEVDEALHNSRLTANLHKAAKLLADLRDLADSVSDGWAYWPKPARAAKQLMELIEASKATSANNWRSTEITDEALKKAVAPIKSFLTKEKKQLQGKTLSLPC